MSLFKVHTASVCWFLHAIWRTRIQIETI